MAASRQSKISLCCFILGSLVCVFPLFACVTAVLKQLWEFYYVFIVVAYHVIYSIVLKIVYLKDRNAYQNGLRAGLLGAAFGVGFLISFSDTTWTHFGWYLSALAFFHWSEYYTTAITNPASLTLDSYMLDHSKEYKLAALASWTEFTLEWFLFPGLKQLTILSLGGLILVIGGEVLRKVSMITACSNFNHYVQHMKQKGHELVTHGVYSVFRHPSYVGWFYWSIGTQLVLCNPVCLVGYTLVSWKFFNVRIYEEELYLLNFFGEEYVNYKRKVGTGLPFISGFNVNV